MSICKVCSVGYFCDNIVLIVVLDNFIIICFMGYYCLVGIRYNNEFFCFVGIFNNLIGRYFWSDDLFIF